MPGSTDIRSILQPIMRLAFSVEKIADRKLRKELDLGISQFRMLMVVRRGTAVRQRDIAEFWGVAEASVSRQIERLRRRGLVERRPNPKNRREHVLGLTPAGSSAIAHAIRAMDKELEGTFSAVPEKDRARLVEGLQRLLAEFQRSHGEKIPESLRDESAERARGA